MPDAPTLKSLLFIEKRPGGLYRMKKLIPVVLILAIFLSTPIYAQTTLFVGLAPGHFQYKEKEHDTTLDKDYGSLIGLNAAVLWTRNPWWMRGNFNFASTHRATYKGQTQSGDPLKFDDEHETVYMFEGDLGYTFEARVPWGIINVTPYTGVGYRRWSRGQTDTNTGNYKEVYTWGFVPLGVNMFPQAKPESWLIGLDLAVLLPFSPRLEAHLHDLNPVFEDVDFELPGRPGFRIQVPLLFKSSSKWSVRFVPMYTYWSFDQSRFEETAGLPVYEPASVTHRFQVLLGVGYTW